MRDPAALEHRVQAVARYSASWTRLLAVLPRGRDATLNDLTRGFVADYRVARKAEGCQGATINRDLAPYRPSTPGCERSGTSR
jgi:hypothetical protein